MDEIIVSVVVPVRNKRFTKYSINMLKAMWKNTKEKRWEMIIVFDDFPQGGPRGEPDELFYKELIESFKDNSNVHVLRGTDSKSNFNFSSKEFRIAAALNWGVHNAVGEYIIFTSDDFYYTPSWLEIMLKLSKQFDMTKTVIHPVNIEDFSICDSGVDVKEKMWSQPYKCSGRRCYFRKRHMPYDISDIELNEYWEKTKVDEFVVEKDCSGKLGNANPFLMRKDLWVSMGGRKIGGDGNGNSETDFHDRLKAMHVTRIVSKNVYIYNIINTANRDIPNIWKQGEK